MNSSTRNFPWIATGVLLTVLSAHCTDLRAATIKLYDADAEMVAPNPTSAAGGTWTAGGLNPSGVTETAGQESGLNYWEINDDNSGGTANSSRAYFAALSATDFTDPAGWTATAIVKVPSASNTPSGVTFEVRGGGKLVNMSFVHDAVDEYIGQSVQGSTAIVPIQTLDLDEYNTFQLWYDPTDQLIDLYTNGSYVATFTPGSTSLNRVLWGSNTSSATGLARWNEVRFETGRAIVPEPASASLVCLAGLGCFCSSIAGRGRRRPFVLTRA